jgi:hypothetical protein
MATRPGNPHADRDATTYEAVSIHFEEKPGEELRQELKDAGFHWDKRSGDWWGLASRMPERYKGRAFDGHQAGAAAMERAAGIA